jgi:Tfp pilus assembly protein PilN
MIRVNLLEPGRSSLAGVRIRRPRAAAIGLAAFLAALVAIGAIRWSDRTDAARVDREIAVVDAELVRLRTAAREADVALTRKKELAARLATLTGEPAARVAPVRRLAAIGRSVPQDVWLTAVRLHGSQVEIDGRAASLPAVTKFAERIQEAGVLTTPVDILSTSAESREGTTLVRFSLRLD